MHYKKQKKLLIVPSILALLFILTGGCSSTPPLTDEPDRGNNSPFTNTIVTLTFDDGDADNYGIREDLLRNNIHATFYITSGFINTTGYMTETQLRQLYEDGNEIGGHSLNHLSLIDIHGADLKHEICQDRTNLISYGFEVVSFAYPFGDMSNEAKQMVRECGYSSARSIAGGPENLPVEDSYSLRAMPFIVDDTSLSKMLRYIKEVKADGGGWVIFIFHHVCDECDYFSVSPSVFSEFTDWLGRNKENGLIVSTVRDVISVNTP